MKKNGNKEETKNLLRRIIIEYQNGEWKDFSNILSWNLSNILLIFFILNEEGIRIPISSCKNIYIFWEETLIDNKKSEIKIKQNGYRESN